MIPCTLGLGEESHQISNGSDSTWPYQSYRSSPSNPPELQITTNGQPHAGVCSS